jgi:hypothetical protein
MDRVGGGVAMARKKKNLFFFLYWTALLVKGADLLLGIVFQNLPLAGRPLSVFS